MYGVILNMKAIYIIILHIILTQSQPNSFEIEYIKTTPGLYYERMGTLFLKKLDWQIVIHLDIQKFLNHHLLLTNYEDIIRNCHNQIEKSECLLLISSSAIEDKNNSLNEIQNQIRILSKAIAEKRESEILPRSIRVKRLAPLGIVGDISKSLFGTATTDDINLINENIDKLFQDQKDVIQLTNERTHIITNMFSEIYNKTRKHDQMLKLITESFGKKINTLKREENGILYLLNGNMYLRKLEIQLDHLIEVNKNLLDILLCLQKQQIHPSLLNSPVLSKVTRDLQTTLRNVRLPIPLDQLRPEELAKVANLDVVHQKNDTLIIMHIPLIDPTDFHLYKLHALPTPQKNTRGELIGSAYIQPTYPYLALGFDHRSYLKFTTEEIANCLNLHYGYICVPQKPLRETSERNDCELTMLLRPNLKGLQSCQLMYQYKNQTHWKYLSTEGSWLFSSLNPETLRITCPQNPDNITTIRSVGILRMAPECVGHTDEVTLINTGHQRSPARYVYKPDVQLEILQIHPQIAAAIDEDKLLGQQDDPIQLSPSDESLKEITRRLTDIQSHKRTQKYHTYFSLGIILIILFPVLTINFYFWKKVSKKNNRTIRELYNESLFGKYLPVAVPSRTRSQPNLNNNNSQELP